MNGAIIAFTQRGMDTGERLRKGLEEKGICCTLCRGGKENPLHQWTKEHFADCGLLVYVGAAGIAVRAVAPFVQDKTRDPAVLCCDEGGRYAIPLLSGHIGGCNRIALWAGEILGAQPILTTATDGRGLFAVDTWATRQGLSILNPKAIKTVSSRLLDGKEVILWSDFPWKGNLPQGVVQGEKGPCHIRITCQKGDWGEALVLCPPLMTAGIGCRKGTAEENIHKAVDNALGQAGLYPQSLQKVASIDLKKEEPGLVAFCQSRGVPFVTYSSEELAALEGDFTPSAFVQKVTGVNNVCERAALMEGGRLILHKQAGEGVTVALSLGECILDFAKGEEP